MTAVEFIISNIIEDQTVKAKSMSEWLVIFDEAKEMEKQQIIDAAESQCIWINSKERSEKYYTETFKSK